MKVEIDLPISASKDLSGKVGPFAVYASFTVDKGEVTTIHLSELYEMFIGKITRGEQSSITICVRPREDVSNPNWPEPPENP